MNESKSSGKSPDNLGIATGSVAGDGPDTDELRARVAGDARVQWLGRISDEERTARIRGADVFCAPSLRGESFGVVLLELLTARPPSHAGEFL